MCKYNHTFSFIKWFSQDLPSSHLLPFNPVKQPSIQSPVILSQRPGILQVRLHVFSQLWPKNPSEHSVTAKVFLTFLWNSYCNNLSYSNKIKSLISKF